MTMNPDGTPNYDNKTIGLLGPEEMAVCGQCSSLVEDTERHTTWHRYLNELLFDMSEPDGALPPEPDDGTTDAKRLPYSCGPCGRGFPSEQAAREHWPTCPKNPTHSGTDVSRDPEPTATSDVGPDSPP
jgi:hypothetical protein